MPPRNQTFHPSHHPLAHHSSLKLDPDRTTGPVSFLNPTTAHFLPADSKESSLPSHTSPSDDENPRPLTKSFQDAATAPASSVSYKWTSRNNRKGRHAISVEPSASNDAQYLTPKVTNSLQAIGRGILRMFITFPVWDVSYDVATIFTLGSVVWCINAFFVFLPLVRPETEFNTEILYGGGITAFIGATIFEVGSFMLMAEAVNENQTGCFGWAIERAFDHNGKTTVRPEKENCSHHHRNKRNLVGKHVDNTDSSSTSTKAKSWTWFPSSKDLREKYLHELGFLASLIQLFAATIFWVSGFTALPGIYDHMSSTITIIFYWTPQVIGGSGFIISGLLFMLETQSRWYKPAFGTLGWHIGLWNMIGGLGFTLCPCFGYDTRSWAQYQASLSTFWGSWAFLIGSTIQWYESLEKFPVEVGQEGKR